MRSPQARLRTRSRARPRAAGGRRRKRASRESSGRPSVALELRRPLSPRRPRRRAGNRWSPCRSPAPAPPSRSRSSRLTAHSLLSWVLVMPWAKVGPSARLRASACASASRILGDQPVVEAPALAFLGGHHPAGEQQFGGAALADDPRQDRAGAHVAAGEADAGEQEGGLRLRRRDPDVRGHRQDRAGAGADAVERRDDRLRAGAHRLDQVAGHPGEGEQARHRPFRSAGR